MTQRPAGLEARLRLALRTVSPAPRGSRERVRSRLAAALLPMDLRSSSPRAATQDGVPLATSAKAKAGAGLLSRALRAGKTVALALLGAAGGAALIASVAARKPAQIVYIERPAAQTPAASSVADAPSSATSTPSAPTSLGADRPATPSTTTSGNAADARRRANAARESGASTFAAERALLDEARAALVEGDPRRALALLRRHRTRFARGALAEERDAMWIEALVAEYRYPEARAAAQAFRAHSPHSLFLPTVDSAVQSIP